MFTIWLHCGHKWSVYLLTENILFSMKKDFFHTSPLKTDSASCLFYYVRKIPSNFPDFFDIQESYQL